jgi:hypothetical protein
MRPSEVDVMSTPAFAGWTFPKVALTAVFLVPFLRQVFGTLPAVFDLVDEGIAVLAVVALLARTKLVIRSWPFIVVLFMVASIWVFLSGSVNNSSPIMSLRVAASFLKGVPIFLAIATAPVCTKKQHEGLLHYIEDFAALVAVAVILQQLYTQLILGLFNPDAGWGLLGVTDSNYLLIVVLAHHVLCGLASGKFRMVRILLLAVGILLGYTNHGLLFGALAAGLYVMVAGIPVVKQYKTITYGLMIAILLIGTNLAIRQGGYIMDRGSSAEEVFSLTAKGVAYGKLYDEVLTSPKEAIWGVGPGEFGSLVGLTYGTSLWMLDIRSWMEDTVENFGGSSADHPFSSVSALLGEIGIPGCLFVLTLYVFAISKVARNLRQKRRQSLELGDGLALFLGLFMLTMSIYMSTLENIVLCYMFWIVTASSFRMHAQSYFMHGASDLR